MNAFEQYVAHASAADLTDKTVFSDAVREGLELTGMSLREAADTFKTAPGTVSRWENGHCAPPMVARIAIIGIFLSRARRIAARLERETLAAAG